MRAINLLPDQGPQGNALSQVSAKSIGIGGASLLVIASLFIGVSFVQSHNNVTGKQDALEALTTKNAKLQATLAKSTASKGSQEALVAAFNAAASARIPWDNVLDDVSRVLPSGSWLSSLNMSVSASTPATATTPASSAATPVGSATTPAALSTLFTVSGYAFSNNEVARVMERLELIPAIQGVTLQNSTRSDVEEKKAFQFTMNATVLPPEVAR